MVRDQANIEADIEARAEVDHEKSVAAEGFPIVRHPLHACRLPVLVSIPHFGTQRIAGVRDVDFADAAYRQFPRGYTDAFAREIYGDLNQVGATVLATPFSRLFVDVNRKRSDYKVVGGHVRSRRGVVRTHIVDDRPLFSEPLSTHAVEERLAQYYDPYHNALERLVAQMLDKHRAGLVLDAHTGSEKGMREHQIIIGTRGGVTASELLRDTVGDVFVRHGFEVHHDVPGYSGAHIVRRWGRDKESSLDAIQIEINSGMLMTVPRREYFARIDRGEPLAVNLEVLDRLRQCLSEVVRCAGAVIGAVVAAKG
jgi:N-formylglutamate amidohydrolase